MKLAVVSESAADEAAIKIIVEAVLGSETELETARLRPNGWPHVLTLLPTIIKALHFNSDAQALALVVDSDDSTLHFQNGSPCSDSCRLCSVRERLARTIAQLSVRPGRPNMHTAVGLAVPSIEAWYSTGIDTHVNEATWTRHLNGERITYSRKSLKESIYGTSQPSLSVETEFAMLAAQRLVDNLDLMLQLFPIGFGCLIYDLRQWPH